MSKSIDSQTNFDDEAESLRMTLAQMRREAEQEVIRLNRRIAERAHEAASSVTSATENLAMQQEMTVLQQTLNAKEQTLDHITEECRRLEDELEDQHIRLDGLQQEMERKDTSLKNAHEETERLRRELQERLKAPLPVPMPAAVQLRSAPASPMRWKWLGYGLLSIALALSAGGFFYLAWDRIAFRLPDAWRLPDFSAPDSSLTDSPPPDDGAPAPVADAGAVAVGAALPAVAVAPARPAIAVQRDRLRGGALAPALVALAGGTFQMGSNSLSGEDFSPAHAVRVRPFLIAVNEVTYQDYDRFARASGRPIPDDFGWGRTNRPVVGVNWNEAQAYADWLSRETNRHYRLPSEAEWEFAARAGRASSYWWGFALERGRAVCFDCGSEWDNRSTAPVGSFAPNPFGLYDMTGNAMEWVADCYRPNYQGAPSDGRAWLDGDPAQANCPARVARGGAFNKPSSSMRVFVRTRFAPATQLNLLGFRVARDA